MAVEKEDSGAEWWSTILSFLSAEMGSEAGCAGVWFSDLFAYGAEDVHFARCTELQPRTWTAQGHLHRVPILSLIGCRCEHDRPRLRTTGPLYMAIALHILMKPWIG